MNVDMQPHRDYTFLIGLLAGTFVGVGLAIWLVPEAAAELRQRMKDSARSVRRQASERYHQTSARLSEAVDELARKGQDVRDGVAGAVARGAHEVESYAAAAKTGGVAETRRRV